MKPSLEFLERSASETGFRVSALEKTVRLGELAADFRRHPFLGNALVLKGGTALNLCFGPPARLSVDLDFNYIGQTEREKMLQERPQIETAVSELARRQGYLVQESADAFAGRKFYLGYRSVLGSKDRIEIDLNYLFRVPLVEIDSRTFWQPGEMERPVVRVVGEEELLLGKLLALLERGAPRDVWDIAHLPGHSGERLTTDFFRRLFVAFSIVLERPLPTYGRERLERQLTERIFREQVFPLLSAQVDASTGDIVERAWEVVGGFLDLSASENAYLWSAVRGDLDLGLIFPGDAERAELIAGHPAIQWKMANVRAHIKRIDE